MYKLHFYRNLLGKYLPFFFFGWSRLELTCNNIIIIVISFNLWLLILHNLCSHQKMYKYSNVEHTKLNEIICIYKGNFLK